MEKCLKLTTFNNFQPISVPLKLVWKYIKKLIKFPIDVLFLACLLQRKT